MRSLTAITLIGSGGNAGLDPKADFGISKASSLGCERTMASAVSRPRKAGASRNREKDRNPSAIALLLIAPTVAKTLMPLSLAMASTLPIGMISFLLGGIP